jgi:predicted transposase/invertase (TIGR01784 family)
LINEIVEYEEGIAMASEVLLTVSRNEVERAVLEHEYKNALDMQSLLVGAKREGRAEGAEEIVRNMKIHGRPLNQIIEDTGLSPEEIEKF